MADTSTIAPGTSPVPSDRPGAPAGRGAAGLRKRVAPWLPAVAAYAAIVAMLLDTGTPVADVARYTLYVGWGLVLPGTLVYRALRGAPHTLVEDLALGATTGLMLEIPAWALFSLAGGQRWLWLWPLLVVVPFVAVPGLRRHWRVSSYRRPSLGWSWAMAGIAVFFVGYVYVTYFRQNEPIPAGADGAWYHIDLMYMLSMVGEAKHHFPIHNPQIVSEPLNYHWFSYAHMAGASLISGVDTPIVFFRLASPVFCVLAVLTLAVAGWRVSGKQWVGALAAMLTFVVGELTLSDMSWGQFGGAVAYMVWSSHSMAYSWSITFALMALVVGLLRAGPAELSYGRGGWALLVLFSVGAVGSKSTVVPVLLGGVALAGLAHLLTRRRIDRRLMAIGAVLVAATLFATVVIYRFATHGLNFGVLAIIKAYADVVPARSAWRHAFVYGFVTAMYLVFFFIRLAGIAVLARLGRPWGQREWFLLGAVLAGAGATLFMVHGSLAQNFFVRSGFAFGAVLSAMGFAALVERYRVTPRTLVAVFAAVGAGVWVIALGLRHEGLHQPTLHMRVMDGIAYYVLALAAAIAIGAVVWLVVLRRRWKGVAAVTLLGTLLLAGVPALVLDGWDHTKVPPRWYHSHVSVEEATAARWLRDNLGRDEVIATNQHCLPEMSKPGRCFSTSFWLSAYSERRQLVGSWFYAPRMVEIAAKLQTSNPPFWDQQMYEDNEIVFTAPTAERVGNLVSRYGVHWLVVDRAQGRESADLANFADLRFSSGPIAIYRIR
ncbi:hypothetical protein AB0K00_42530 [Dactylosporangium sp. NPDC049525]|uniref:hypothetical protein n=1 Tax=Dactylosporangium sp. NPDC049525 TaxID=3154730 RepID=UPI003437B16E